MLQTTSAWPYAYHCSSYTVIKDLEGKGYYTSKTVGNDLWPKLHFQYSNAGPAKKLDMVRGEFTTASSLVAFSSSAGASSSSAGASSLSAGASSAASQSATGPPTRVTVKSYTANGRLCYSWKSDNVEDRSYADAWSPCKNQNGEDLVIHKAKNLVSVPP